MKFDYTKRDPTRPVRKVCRKCKRKAWYSARTKMCRLNAFGRQSYWCYGQLDRVERKRDEIPLDPAPGLGLGSLLGDAGHAAAIAHRGQRVRTDAEKKLARARTMVTEKTREMARLARRLRAWERKASYYAKRAAATDAEIEAERRQRVERADARKARRRIRGIALGT